MNGAVVEPIPVHFSINERNVGGRLAEQNGGLGNDAAARQSSDRGLDMEGADSLSPGRRSYLAS